MGFAVPRVSASDPRGISGLANGILRYNRHTSELYFRVLSRSYPKATLLPTTYTSIAGKQRGLSRPHLKIGKRHGGCMRKIGYLIGVMLIAVLAVAAPKAQRTFGDRPFPAVLKNAQYVYVAAYDGDQFDPRVLPEDRAAVAAVQDSIRKWGKLTLVYRPSEADVIVLVESRPSEDVLAVYERGMSGGQYLWRAMGRDGLQTGETPLATEFEKGFDSVQTKSSK